MLWQKKLKERKVYFACCLGGEGIRAEAAGHVTTVRQQGRGASKLWFLYSLGPPAPGVEPPTFRGGFSISVGPV